MLFGEATSRSCRNVEQDAAMSIDRNGQNSRDDARFAVDRVPGHLVLITKISSVAMPAMLRLTATQACLRDAPLLTPEHATARNAWR